MGCEVALFLIENVDEVAESDSPELEVGEEKRRLCPLSPSLSIPGPFELLEFEVPNRASGRGIRT